MLLFYFKRNTISTYINIGPSTSPNENNLWYAQDGASRSKPGLPVAEKDGIYGSDPLFKNSTGGDFALVKGSPAIGKGTPLGGVIKGDMAGRCYQNPPAIGAFEGP